MRRHTNQGKPATGRSCKSCRFCCVHLKIESRDGHSTRLDTGEDLAKPAHEPCRYLIGGGCSIYEQRPLVCRQFACDWLIGTREYNLSQTPLATGVIGVRGEKLNVESWE